MVRVTSAHIHWPKLTHMAPRDTSLGSQAWLSARKARVFGRTVSAKFTEPFAKRLGRKIKLNSCRRMSLVRTWLLLPWTGMSSLGTSVLNINCTSEPPEGVGLEKLLYLSFPSDFNLSDPWLQSFQNPWGDSKVQPGLRMSILSCFNVLCFFLIKFFLIDDLNENSKTPRYDDGLMSLAPFHRWGNQVPESF